MRARHASSLNGEFEKVTPVAGSWSIAPQKDQRDPDRQDGGRQPPEPLARDQWPVPCPPVASSCLRCDSMTFSAMCDGTSS